MSAAVKERIFEPFYTTTGKDKGTGLGLSATYGTIQQHNGSITVESELNKGTCFTLLLPANQNQVIDTQKEPAEIADISMANILIIDDEEIILETVSEMLKTLNCHVSIASNGPDGIAIYRENPLNYDIIILDKIMPLMNGKDVYLELQKINPQVKVILASGYSDEQAQEILDLGVADFIRKPYTISDLSKILSKQLQR